MGAPNLLNPERRMLRAMQLSDADRSWDLASLLAACDWTDQAVAVGAGHGLENHGYVSVSETRMREVRLDVEGERAVEDGLLEQRLWSWISEQSTATMTDLQHAFARHDAAAHHAGDDHAAATDDGHHSDDHHSGDDHHRMLSGGGGSGEAGSADDLLAELRIQLTDILAPALDLVLRLLIQLRVCVTH